MSDSPFFQFYPSDWLAGTRGLTAAETGVYITLVAMMYEAEGPIANDPKRLARLCGSTPAAFRKAMEGLVATRKLIVDERGIFNERAEKEIGKRSEKRASATASANARWQKNEQKQCADDADASISQCERNANQKPEPEVSNSEANASGCADPVKALWDAGVGMLTAHGVPEAQARKVIGKWRKDQHPDAEILSAILDFGKAGAVDPIPWITARLAAKQPPARLYDLSKFMVQQ